MIFRTIYKSYVALIFATLLLIFYPLMYFLLIKTKRFNQAFRIIRFHAKSMLFLSGIKLKVKGKIYLNQPKPVIFCANHTSLFDIFCFYAIIKDYYVFTGKQEIQKWPLFHIYYTSGMNILIDRSNKTKSILAFKKMIQTIREGKSIAIFPEGTISKNAPDLLPFKEGAFSLAIQTGTPIIPITLKTNWRRLQKGSFLKGLASPGISEIIISQAIPTHDLKKENTMELQQKIQKIINDELKN